ncbi:hypothetical protein FKM82_016382 [Ascaphus truei]
MEGEGNPFHEPLAPASPAAGTPGDAPSVLAKFSIRSFFGITTKLETPKPKEENAVLKAFRAKGSDATVQPEAPGHAQQAHSMQSAAQQAHSMQSAAQQAHSMQSAAQQAHSMQSAAQQAHSMQSAAQQDKVQRGTKGPEELGEEEPMRSVQIADSDLEKQSLVDLQCEEMNSQDTVGQENPGDRATENQGHYPQLDYLGVAEVQVLQEQSDEKEGVCTERLKAAVVHADAVTDVPPSADLTATPVLCKADYDQDGLLVRGTLVHTTSDTDSDSESPEPFTSQKTKNAPVSKDFSASHVSLNNGPKQELETQELGGADFMEKAMEELDPNRSESVGANLDTASPADNVTEQDLSVGSSPHITFSSDPSKAAPLSEAQGDKTFQLPAFFSGLRVHKKGAYAEEREMVTEVKPKDSDLALLKLSQPVQKSKLPLESLARKRELRKSAEPKASSSFLEQLSQLLNLDSPKQEETEEIPPEHSEDTEQDTEGVTVDRSEAESALDAFKSLFIRPPRKVPALDLPDLDAVKRKQKSEKETLKSIFDKTRPADTDQASLVRKCSFLYGSYWGQSDILCVSLYIFTQ